jgi:hypothetical protein
MIDLVLKYGGHISLATGKVEEHYRLRGGTVADLVEELDGIYPGFKDIFVPPLFGIMNMRTAIFLRRPGHSAHPVLDPKFELQDGDSLLMW